MLSERLLSVLLALLVLSAVVTPLSVSIASGRGEEIVIERLVVLDPSGRVRRVESLGWRAPLARLDCPSCGKSGLEVLSERVSVLANESRTSGRVTERLMAIRLERIVRDPSRPCPIYVGLDVAAYARETPTYKASVVLLNIRSPRGGYFGSVAFVKVFPLDRDPVPRGEVVIAEEPKSVGRALGLAVSHLGADPGSVMGRLGLVSAVSEAVAGLASTASGRVGELLGRETGFLAVVFVDPDIRHWRPDLALLGELEPDPTTSDAKDPGDGNDECLTDQDCYLRYPYHFYCTCSSDCVELDWDGFILCVLAFTLSGCPPCPLICGGDVACLLFCGAVVCPALIAVCELFNCLVWSNICVCHEFPAP